MIVETAAGCFVELGFHQTSMRDVAARAGISLGNLYNHFESKAALIAEIASLEALELDVLERQIAGIRDPDKAFDRFVALYLEQSSQPDNIALAQEIVSEGLRNAEIRAGFLENRARLKSTVTGTGHRAVA